MGTTLTGTKPKDTYDSLIKVTDNGPISGTAKYLSDGLGNDLPIAVSTSKVGIGTSTPFFKLDVDGSVGLSFAGALYIYYLDATNHALIGNDGSGNMTFATGTSGVTEKARITTDGYLRLATNGIQFNGDTAAANALDDYEEGTWTMAAAPSSSGTITLDGGVNAGSYTKIGRQVTVTGLAEVSAVSLPVGTAVNLSGLPFPIAARALDYDSRIGGSVTVASAGTILPRAFIGTETNSTISIYVDASTISAGNQIYISFTYIA
jgi:hypothetical protein